MGAAQQQARARRRRRHRNSGAGAAVGAAGAAAGAAAELEQLPQQSVRCTAQARLQGRLGLPQGRKWFSLTFAGSLQGEVHRLAGEFHEQVAGTTGSAHGLASSVWLQVAGDWVAPACRCKPSGRPKPTHPGLQVSREGYVTVQLHSPPQH